MTALREALRELPEAVFADLLEADDAYLLVLDLPGVDRDDTEISAVDGRIRIEAHREKGAPTGYTYLSEDRDLFVDLELPVPPDADEGEATASIERGVLELRLPKRPGDRGTTIPIEDA